MEQGRGYDLWCTDDGSEDCDYRTTIDDIAI